MVPNKKYQENKKKEDIQRKIFNNYILISSNAMHAS